MKQKLCIAAALYTALLWATPAFAETITVQTGVNPENWTIKYYGEYPQKDGDTVINYRNYDKRLSVAEDIANGIIALDTNGLNGGVYNDTNKGIRYYGKGDAEGEGATYGDGAYKSWIGRDKGTRPPVEVIGVYNGFSAGDPNYHNAQSQTTDSQSLSWNLGGFYTFEYVFNLADALTMVSIEGNVWIDNSLFAVQLVGPDDFMEWIKWGEGIESADWVASGTKQGGELDYPIAIVANFVDDLAVGEYKLIFYGMNGYTTDDGTSTNTCGPMAFAADLEITGSSEGAGGTTPEPATMLIVGLGLFGAGVAARRKMKA